MQNLPRPWPTLLIFLLGVGISFPCSAQPTTTTPPLHEKEILARPGDFPTLVNPNCSHCIDEAKRRKNELKETDQVLVWTRGKYDGGTIPFRFFLNSYRVISDTYGTFVHDPDAGFSRAFPASLKYRFHGWHRGVMVMKHEDGTIFSCLTGRALAGPRQGKKLDFWPTLVATWGWTMKNYPQGVAYHMYEKYQPREAAAKPNEYSLKSRARWDQRLPAEELVLGVMPPCPCCKPLAIRLNSRNKNWAQHLKFDNGHDLIFMQQVLDKGGFIATAYYPIAEKRAPTQKLGVQGELLETKAIKLHWVSDSNTFQDVESKSVFDITGRAVSGKLKGWTLQPAEAVVVKWFAWATELPETELLDLQKLSPTKPQADPRTPKRPVSPEQKLKEIAGTAEYLRDLPKLFATFEGYESKTRLVQLRLDGESASSSWQLPPDAEIKKSGYWGRITQFQKGDRVWVWFNLNRAGAKANILMLADAASEKWIHGEKVDNAQKLQAAKQRTWLEKIWQTQGLPGTITFSHISGEVTMMLDHEAMRWARSLRSGDQVKIMMDSPAPAVVKSVGTFRERTVLQLVVNGKALSELHSGQRHLLLMKKPAPEILTSIYPPDCDQPRTRDERIQWFLSSIYCTCGVGKNICTGHFFTLSSCNPNGCGLPNTTKKQLGLWIDQGKSDRQIFDELLKHRGEQLFYPHLKP